MWKTAVWMVVVLAPRLALADTHADAVAAAKNSLEMFVGWLDSREIPERILADAHNAPGECTKAIAKAKQAGVVPSDVLLGGFRNHPKAKKTEAVSFFTIEFGEADWICSTYAIKFKVEAAAAPIRIAADYKRNHATPPSLEGAKGYSPGAGKGTAEIGKKCLATVEKAIKDGLAPTTPLKTSLGDTTLEGSKALCQYMIDHGTKFEDFIVAAHKADQAERAKKYEAAGIKGAKLALMVEYDDIYWRGKGCETIDDPVVLAKATRLYQWLENADGTHTIRTYLFAGNAVKGKSERTYQTEAAAYKGCP